jgi:hypothetical protein
VTNPEKNVRTATRTEAKPRRLFRETPVTHRRPFVVTYEDE